MTECSRKKRTALSILALITLGGMVLRLASCFWGYPMALHPDEFTIVDNAIDMLRRHSWLAFVYNRPDQFEIKCNAALFAVASRILFGVPAYEAFETHYMAFYVIARGFTAIFGTAMIPLAAILAGRMVKKENRLLTQLITAFVFAFSPVLVEHSAYATPDIVLTFFVLLFALISQKYLESGKTMWLWLSVVVTGVGISIKYPAGILCLVIAASVIYRCIREKTYGKIVLYGLLSIGLLLLTLFVIAPNLFTDFRSVYDTLVFEARPNHLGADGLGWFGNLRFYLNTMIRDMEPFSLLGAAAGLIWILRNRSERTAVLLIAPVYLACISVLSLHWIQWGIPVYVFYDLLTAIGFSALLYWIRKADSTQFIKKPVTAIYLVFTGVLGLNLLLSAAGLTKNKLVEDTRSVSLRYCLENGVNTANSLFEGYTPLSPNGAAGYRYYAFHMTDGKACVNEPYATKRYFITSGAYSGRFLEESEQYPDEAEIYRAIPDSFEEIYRVEGAGSYSPKRYAYENILYTLRFLREQYPCTGATIYFYDLNPQCVTIEKTGETGIGLAVDEGKIGAGKTLQNWVVYNRDDGKIVLLCAENNLAMGWSADGSLITVEPEAENECRFDVIQRSAGITLLSEEGALTLENGKPVLRPAEDGNTAQEWTFASVKDSGA